TSRQYPESAGPNQVFREEPTPAGATAKIHVPAPNGAHPYLVTPDHTARARTVLGPGPILAPEQGAVLETDPARARATARRHLALYLTLPNYVNNFREMGFGDADFADGGSDRLVDGLVAWGNVDAIVERVRRHHAAGADHVAIQAVTPDPARAFEELQLL